MIVTLRDSKCSTHLFFLKSCFLFLSSFSLYRMISNEGILPITLHVCRALLFLEGLPLLRLKSCRCENAIKRLRVVKVSSLMLNPI